MTFQYAPEYPYTIWSEPYPNSRPEPLDREGVRYVGEYRVQQRAQAEALRMCRTVGVRHIVRDERGFTISEHLPPEENGMTKYASLRDLAAKIDYEGSDYFFTEYGFGPNDLPEGTPADVVSKAADLAWATQAYSQAKSAFMACLPDADEEG